MIYQISVKIKGKDDSEVWREYHSIDDDTSYDELGRELMEMIELSKSRLNSKITF